MIFMKWIVDLMTYSDLWINSEATTYTIWVAGRRKMSR